MAQEHQDQVLSTSKIYLPQRDKKQGIRDKDRRKRMKETKGEKKQGKRERNFCPRGDLDNTLPLGRQKTDVTYRKMRVYKAKGETPS